MKRLMLLFLILSFIMAIAMNFFNPSLASRLYSKWFSHSEEKKELILYGNVDIRQVDLGFRVKGRVATMPFEEGDLVAMGSLMSMLDKQPYKDQVNQAAAQVESAQAALVNSTLLLERRKILIGTGGISEQDIDDAIAGQKIDAAKLKEAQASLGVAQTNLADTELYAPADGTILTRIREPGTVVREADPIYTLSLISPIWVRTYVSEPQLGLIYPGMEAAVYTDTPGGHHYSGHIGFISPVAEFTPKTVETAQLRTDLVYRLRVIVDNDDHGLRQGMPVTVKLPLKS
ncbi:MAG: efflux RND transporter periplasmic adaptor subunit [Parachlamydiaceae bacterium]